MKLKEYLYYLVADSAVSLVDADVKNNLDEWDEWRDEVLFYDKTLIPKEVLNLEVRKFCGSLYFPGDFDPEDYDYDIYEDWFADVKFYVEGFKKVADKLGLRRVEK